MIVTKKYQVTILCETGQYKPISTIVIMKQEDDTDWTLNKEKRSMIKTKGLQAICIRRSWTKKDLVKEHYTKIKVRAVDD